MTEDEGPHETTEPSPQAPPPTEQAVPDTADPAAVGAPQPSDTLVETALRRLPVPEHAPGFWEDLDAALAAEPRRQTDEPSLAVGPGRATTRGTARSATVAPRPQRLVAAPTQPAAVAAGRADRDDPTRRLVPPSLRRRSNVVLLVLLVAAISLVVICGVALVRHRSVGGLGPRPASPSATGPIASSER